MDAAPEKKGNHKLLTVIIIVALVALVGALELKRQAVQAQLLNLTDRLDQVQINNDAQNRETAQRIISAVRELIEIPEDIDPTVATIVDVEALRERNPFYNKAENGDHLIVTNDRAILYSSTDKIILDVVPVQLQTVEDEAAAVEEAEAEAAAAAAAE